MLQDLIKEKAGVFANEIVEMVRQDVLANLNNALGAPAPVVKRRKKRKAAVNKDGEPRKKMGRKPQSDKMTVAQTKVFEWVKALGKPVTATQVATGMKVSKPTIWAHLKKLKALKVLKEMKGEGRSIYYQIRRR